MKNRLASSRRAQGISLKEMAERLHISENDALAIEEGRTPSQACSVEQLCVCYGGTAAELFPLDAGEKEPPEQLSAEEQQLLTRLRALNRADRVAALDEAEGLAHGEGFTSSSKKRPLHPKG